jgi:hypothetical protein
MGLASNVTFLLSLLYLAFLFSEISLLSFLLSVSHVDFLISETGDVLAAHRDRFS